MSERVRVYVGTRRRPTLSFDLMDGVTLTRALREVTDSIERLRAAKLAGAVSCPPRTKRRPVEVQEILQAINGNPHDDRASTAHPRV